MESLLISIQPKWCELIANGKKTIEVRKTKPKIDTPFKCYIYCTYGEGLIEANDEVLPNHLIGLKVTKGKTWGNCCNGKVIGEFVCDAIIRNCEMANADIAEQQGRIKREKLLEYANGKELYGWHISDLVIYDKPKELSEFYRWTDYDDSKNDKRPCAYCGYNQYDYSENHEYCAIDYDGERCVHLQMKRPPQSWCYIEHIAEKGS